jgi:hypothetical protein
VKLKKYRGAKHILDILSPITFNFRNPSSKVVMDGNPVLSYRRHICQFLSNTQDPVLKEIETTLGLKCLQDERRSDTSMSVYKNAMSKHDKNMDLRVPSLFIHCHCCGSYLTGPIRMQRWITRGRSTARRRASRRKAQRKRQQDQETKVRSVMVESKHCHKEFWKEWNNHFQISDGTCKNVIVQRCSHCGTKRKSKGLLSNIRKPKQNMAIQEMSFQLENSKANTESSTKAVETTLKPKKTKKQKTAPKTALMEFLSSLNS